MVINGMINQGYQQFKFLSAWLLLYRFSLPLTFSSSFSCPAGVTTVCALGAVHSRLLVDFCVWRACSSRALVAFLLRKTSIFVPLMSHEKKIPESLFPRHQRINDERWLPRRKPWRFPGKRRLFSWERYKKRQFAAPPQCSIGICWGRRKLYRWRLMWIFSMPFFDHCLSRGEL